MAPVRPAQTIETKAALAAYIANKVGTTPQQLVGQMPFEVLMTLRGGNPSGALLYSNYRGNSIEMSAAGEPGWLTRPVIRAMFYYPFLQLRCWTLLVMINRNNRTSREISRRLGFNELCVIESGKSKGEDIILYGMTREECLWIAGFAPYDHANGALHHGERCAGTA